MSTIKFKQEDIEQLKNLASTFYQIYEGEDGEETIWSFEDVEDMRIIGQDFIEIVMSYINQNKNA